jgi:uncharacterized phage protein (TIGR02218 family)
VSRTLTASLTTHLSGHAHTRCNMLLLDLLDGTSIAITDHDKPLAYDIGGGTKTYAADTGILTSNVSLACGLDADNYEVTGPIGDTITLDGILGGLYNRARARLFQVDWKNLTAGAIKILAGDVSEVRAEGGKFVMEIRSDVDHYNQVVGRVITNQCDADFADGIRCHATATEIVGTVTASTDPLHMTVSFAGSYANDFFNKGTVIGLTGANAGVTMDIEDWTSAGAIVLFAPLVETPAVGDTFTVRNGCAKSRAACIAHNQIVDFRGFPEVPGRKILIPAVPGA